MKNARNRPAWSLAFVLATSAALAQASPPAFELLEMLVSGDEQARAQARQLLPREDVQVVPRLVSLLGSDNDVVRLTAFNVLADFANQVSVPGREADRDVVTASLMTLIAPEQPVATKMLGLRLLPLVVADGTDLRMVAVLLDDAELREKALAALVEMGTPGAAAVMCNHLHKADPAFACAILDGLGQMRIVASLEAIAAQTQSKHPSVRVAAARALVWTGNPGYLTTLQQVLSRADDDTRSDAIDAWLRLVRAMELAGGNWQIVAGEYRRMLESADAKIRMAGLAGLGRIGDGSCVEPILTCIDKAAGFEWTAGIQALENLRGVDVCREITSAYSSLPRKTQLDLLAVLGRKQHVMALNILQTAAENDDPAIRAAALTALGESAQPQAVTPLAAACVSRQGEEQTVAREALIHLGDTLRQRGHAGAAGNAYVAALAGAAAHDKELHRRALVGLAVSPVPQAFEIARQAAAEPDLRDVALPLLVAVGDKLVEAKDNDKAMELYQQAMQLHPDAPTLRALADKLVQLGSPVDWAAQLGIVRHWRLVGPFELGEENVGWDRPYIGEPEVDLKARYMSGKRRLDWQTVTANDRGVVDMSAALGQVDSAIGYAYAEIHVKAATDAVLRIGADDSEKVWLNGEQMFELWAARPMTLDQDKIPVKLQAGTNTILMKVWQNTMGWEFCVRITTPEDKPIAFTQ